MQEPAPEERNRPMHDHPEIPEAIPTVTEVPASPEPPGPEAIESIPYVIPVPTVVVRLAAPPRPARPEPIPTVLAVPDGPEPRRRGRPWIAWGVIVLEVVGIVSVPQFVRSTARDLDARDRISTLLMGMQGRYMVGLASLVGDNRTVYAQVQALDAGPLPRRLRFAVLAGELSGPKEATAKLDRLDQLLARSDAEPAEEDLAAKDVLRRLYADYEQGRLDAPSLDTQDRQLLRRELGWFGELALSPAGGPNPAERNDVIGSARRTLFVVLGFVTGGAALGFFGLVGLVVLIVLAAMGRLRRGLTAPTPHDGVYAETFAVWFFLFGLLSVGASFLPAGNSRMLVSGAASFLSLLALAWPVLRGVPWAQVRRDIGWTGGKNPLLEALLGVGTYAMSLPLLGVGVLIMVMLMTVHGLVVGGPNAHDSLAPTGEPQHPIVEVFAKRDWWQFLQVLFVASVAAPIIEETMFRGVLYRQLRDATGRFGVALSILLSAVAVSFVFAVIHPQGWMAVPALMSLALGFTLAREWRGTLLPAMVAHGVNNGVLMLMMILAFGG
jgi:membrane protease YdiL (CAAX protease family)